MTISTTTSTLHRRPAAETPIDRLRVSPYLHLGPDRLYNPLADRMLIEGEVGYRELRRLQAGEASVDQLPSGLREVLVAERWLVSTADDGSRAYRLKYVSLEAHSVCNQACFFCPVSVAPRDAYFMPTELYARILDQLAEHRDSLEGVFMINYNEPTADRRFVEQVRAIKQRGLHPAVLTNGSGLTPDRVDALCAMGGLRFLSINLSTLDREKYRRERGVDQAELVGRHLDYACLKPLADDMEIVVLGSDDAEHDAAFEQIATRYGGSRFRIERRRLMDRAGYLEVGDTASLAGVKLCGCENTGSRPLQHLHITAHGKCVLCCEDYDEKYVVGDLARQTLDQVLASDEFARMRRWAYGVEEAPDDFICRSCVFAITCAPGSDCS